MAKFKPVRELWGPEKAQVVEQGVERFSCEKYLGRDQ